MVCAFNNYEMRVLWNSCCSLQGWTFRKRTCLQYRKGFGIKTVGTIFSVSLGKYLSSLDGCQTCLQSQQERRRQEDSTLRASLDYKVIASLTKEKKKTSFWLFHIYKEPWGMQAPPQSIFSCCFVSHFQTTAASVRPSEDLVPYRTHGFRIHSTFSRFASHFFLPFSDKTSFSFIFPPAILWHICNWWELQLPLASVFITTNNNIKRMDSKFLPKT